MGRIYQLTFDDASTSSKDAPSSVKYDPCTKRLVQKTTVYTLPQTSIDFGYVMGGMAIDYKGKLWVALCGAGMIMRIDPLTGQEMFKLHMEATRPTSVAFGELIFKSISCLHYRMK